MTTEPIVRENPTRRSPVKIVIINVPDAACIARALTDRGNHELVTNEVGKPGRSHPVTTCLYCDMSWADLDAALNPTAKGRKL